MAEYWGSRWPEIEAAIAKTGLDIDKAIEPPPPWEEVAEAFAEEVPLRGARREGVVLSVMSWLPPESDGPENRSEWLRRRYGFKGEPTTAVIQGLEDACAAENEELRMLGEEKADRIETYLFQRWATGDFVKGPFSTVGVSDEQGFYSWSTAHDGWSIVMTLRAEDCPDIMELTSRRWPILARRDELARAFLRQNR